MKDKPTITTESGRYFLITDNPTESLSCAVNWQVYIILCSDGSLYTGITTNVERRLRQHASGEGAKYFRGRAPREVVFLETGHTRSSASRRESRIKSMSRVEKMDLMVSTDVYCSDSIKR